MGDRPKRKIEVDDDMVDDVINQMKRPKDVSQGESAVIDLANDDWRKYPGNPHDLKTFCQPTTESEVAAYCGYEDQKDFRAFCCSYLMLETISEILLKSSVGMTAEVWNLPSILEELRIKLRKEIGDESAEDAFGTAVNLFSKYPIRSAAKNLWDKSLNKQYRQLRLAANIYRLRQALKHDVLPIDVKQRRQATAATNFAAGILYIDDFPRVDVQNLVYPKLGPYEVKGEDELEAYSRLYAILKFIVKRCVGYESQTWFTNENFFNNRGIHYGWAAPEFMRSDSYHEQPVPRITVTLKVPSVPTREHSVLSTQSLSRGFVEEDIPDSDRGTSPLSSLASEVVATLESEISENMSKSNSSGVKNEGGTTAVSTQQGFAGLSQTNEVEKYMVKPGTWQGSKVFKIHWQLEDSEVKGILTRLGLLKKIDVKQTASFDPREFESVDQLISAIMHQFELDNLQGEKFKIDMLFARHTDHEGDEVRANLFKRAWAGDVNFIIATATPIVFEFWVKPVPKEEEDHTE